MNRIEWACDATVALSVNTATRCPKPARLRDHPKIGKVALCDEHAHLAVSQKPPPVFQYDGNP